jgi:carbamoyl-phosphate synthase large subunit
MKVLVSGIGKRNALIKLLKSIARNFDIDLVGGDASDFPPARFEVDQFIVLSSAYQENFVDDYTSKSRDNKIDACITLIDPEIPRISEIEEFSTIRVFHPSKNTSLLCEDKFEFFCAAENAGISTIKTMLEPPDCYPFIRKDRLGSAASGFAVYVDRKSYDDSDKSGNYIYQPYCSGRHFCVDAYVSYYSGKLIDLCIKEVLNKRNGESFLLKSIISEEIVCFIDKICQWLPLRGIVNFDIYDDCGELRVMEINCRIGGNYPASHAFGCDLLSLFCSEISSSVACNPKYSKYKPDQLVAKYFEFSSPRLLTNLC